MTDEETLRKNTQALEDDVGVEALDVELKCLDASRCIDTFTDPDKRQDALDEYTRLVSDAVKEAFAIVRAEDRDAAIRYIINVSCEAKDFRTADALLAKIVLEDHRRKAAQAISEARLQAMAE